MKMWFEAPPVMGTLSVNFPTRILSPCFSSSWRYRDPPRLFSSIATPSWKRFVVPPTIEYGRIRPLGNLSRAKNPGSSSSPSPGLSKVKEVILFVCIFFSTTSNSCHTSGSFFFPPFAFSSSSALSFATRILNAPLHSSPNSSILSSCRGCQHKIQLCLKLMSRCRLERRRTSINF